MWMRRPDAEIQELLAEKERRNRSLIRPFTYSIVIGLICMAAYYLGFRGGSVRVGFVYTSSAGLTWQSVGTGFFMCVFVFVGALFYRKKGWSFLSEGDSLRRCDSCKELSQINPAMLCECGGKLEPSEFFTWEGD